MATSTEATVRTTIANAIRGISGSLGFSTAQGNVREYPIEFHRPERLASYLTAKVGAVNEPRAWAVDVRGHDEPFTMNNIVKRTYDIRIYAYYAVRQEDAQNYTDMIDHARLVREAIIALGINLSGTVTRILGTTPFDYSVVSLDPVGPMYVGSMRISAERTNPDF